MPRSYTNLEKYHVTGRGDVFCVNTLSLGEYNALNPGNLVLIDDVLYRIVGASRGAHPFHNSMGGGRKRKEPRDILVKEF